MKRLFTCTGLLLLTSLGVLAQPVLTNSLTKPPVGTIDSVSNASAGAVDPGPSGTGVTWDLSALHPTTVGVAEIVDCSGTPYYSTFPSANFCIQLTPLGTSTHIYDYDHAVSTTWETLANDYGGPGTGTDYSPNPESDLIFPFNYGDSHTDTFEKTTGGPYTVVLTYDGYGTLKTPYATYSNVVRIKKYWGPGDYDYNWYSTSPYFFILGSYDNQSANYTIVGGSTTAVSTVNEAAPEIIVYPNPVSPASEVHVRCNNCGHGATMTLADITGRVVKNVDLKSSETSFSCNGLSAGMYFYAVYSDGKKIANGKLAVQ